MITPRFTVSQDSDFVHFHIRVPYVRVADMDVVVQGCLFKISVAPYFLSLTLPHAMLQDGRERAEYNYDAGTLVVTVPKSLPGENFPGLDMLTSLLTNPSHSRPAIEIVGQTDAPPPEEEEDIDWSYPQTLPSVSISTTVRYGFNNQYSGVFGDHSEGLSDILQSPDPDHIPPGQRAPQREAHEDTHFDPEHYLCDFVEDTTIAECLRFKPWYYTASEIAFSPEEQDQLLRLPRREYLVENVAREWLAVVDVVFAYCYDHRTTDGEHTCESGWTISTLSCQLSWLDAMTNLAQLQRALFHRALTFPLYRSFPLCQAVWGDVVQVFTRGRAAIVRALLAVKAVLDASDSRYLLNTVVVDDLCVWLQTASEAHLTSLVTELGRVAMVKSDIRWDLERLERSLMEADILGDGGEGEEGGPLPL